MNKIKCLFSSLGRAALYGLVAAALFWQQGFAYQMSEDNVKKAVETWLNITTKEGDSAIKVEKMEPYQEKGLVVAYIAHLKSQGFCLCAADNHLLPVYLYNPKGTYVAGDPDYQSVLSAIGAYMRGETSGQLIDESELRWREQYWSDLIAGIKPEPWKPDLSVVTTKAPSMASAQGPAQTSASSEVQVDWIVLNLTSKWYQGAPYNEQCPATARLGTHCLVGCNATAGSQLAYYWKWPNTGVGVGEPALSLPFDSRWSPTPPPWIEEPFPTNPGIIGWNGLLEWGPDAAGTGTNCLKMGGDWETNMVRDAKQIRPTDAAFSSTLDILFNHLPNTTSSYPITASVNFGAATYDWSQMQDEHTATTTGNTEVAKLCYHMGAHSNTAYGTGITNGNLNNIRMTLVNHLRYSSDAAFYPPVGTQYERNQMVAEMQEELRWLRPVLLGGTGAPGGHAYVIWGFDTRQGYPMFLFNYGWGKDPITRKDSIWYTLPGSEFPNEQDRLVQVAPYDVVRFVGPSASPGEGNPNNPYSDFITAVSAVPGAGKKLILKAGTTEIIPNNSYFTKEMTVVGHESVITTQ